MMLVVEGIVPFLLPGLWRETFRKLVALTGRAAALYRADFDAVRSVVVVLDQIMQNWLLPEYIQDMLPDEAWRIEQHARASCSTCCASPAINWWPRRCWNMPNRCCIDGSDDMDLRTFKLVDQLSGRTLALRADITPQVARIDAHLLNRQGVVRLCYAGSVLHTQPAGLTRTREPLQIGAELYGHGGLESDLEIQQLMLQSLALLGIRGRASRSRSCRRVPRAGEPCRTGQEHRKRTVRCAAKQGRHCFASVWRRRWM